ncbi:MAG: HAMP domain-containing protein [Alphaproteobacteria bacterium]|nr:HAMP domain-containing protein [Alphaproteobacteria bacterium]
MERKHFLSLNAKIFLSLFIVIAGIFSLFLSTFMISYVRQIEQEALATRKKAESIYELYNENTALRKIISDLRQEKEDKIEDTYTKLWNDQDDRFVLKTQDERLLALRQEVLRDLRGSRERENKLRVLQYFVLTAFLLVFVILELLWLIVGRWVLRPVEQLLEATHRISSGDLDFRLPIASKQSKNDEFDILARDFNKMADDIQKYIQDINGSKEFLQNLIDNIPDGIRVLDEDYNIILTNSSYDKINQTINGTECKKCFMAYGNTSPCPATQHPCTLALLKENANKPINVIQRYTDSESREKFVEVSAAASYHQTETGNVLWVIELVRPLDKAILFSHQQKLSAVGMLASSVAHEMRNPLGSVRLILENILDKMDKKPMSSEDLKHYLELVNDQISLCINVTSRLLKLSKKPEKERTAVDLNEVVLETASLLEYEAKKIGVEVVIHEAEKAAVISASDAEMRMVVVNLMQNAFHAMSDGGRLNIEIKAEKDAVVIDFKDTGSGIAPENISRIFEPFFTKGADKGKNEGTGLGLSIVKTIVENYNGVISVESTVGQGTTFRLNFQALKK